ncbi:MAG: flippase [Clostridia bacterium]|nr:flippase [Clostridia bacterium]
MLKKLRNSPVASNAGWIIACKLCKAALTLVSTMIVSRYLGVDKYGILHYASSLVTFFTPIMQLGLNEILVHEIIASPEREGKTVGTVVVMNLAASILCVLGIVGFVSVLHADEKDTILVCICYSLKLVFQATEMIFYWFQAKLKSKYTSLAILAAYICVVLLQALFIFLHFDVYLFALANALEFLLITVILLAFYFKQGAQKLSFSMSAAKELFSKSKYYIISGLMVVVFSQTDKMMLKWMCDNAEVGFYSAAMTCATMTSFVFVAIIDSIRPTIFSSKNDTAQFEQKLKFLYSVIIWCSLLQSAVMTVASPIIIRILYGAEYMGAINILRIVVWFTTFSYIGTVRNIWILSCGYQRYLGWINLSGAMMNIMLNALMIPHYGAIGAAIASVISQIFTNVIIGYILPPLRKNNKLMFQAISPKPMIKYILGK